MELNVDVFHNFFPGNALVTAGNLEDYNTMTIGWGALGSIWGKDAVTIYVRDSRYTLEYLRKCDYFTIDFFENEHKKDLAILGNKSGRDGDKVALTSLTPEACDHGVRFKEAKYTLVCKKMYEQKMDLSAMPEEIQNSSYKDGDLHNMFIGEVVGILK
ncbi:flavin reductase family protein [Intestinibaculum porci]|uniref:flavin reductase family protein n=1 Tax=Intestinibaculum porci TaxID=2487118 RepID=UPI00240988B8|nr:flavin reductase [Intestinibaculum porci]MDD6349223.1 flavin reductase [Intestinibaculum porci]